MEVKYDQSQDITLILNKVNKALLTKEKTKDFFESPLKGFSKTLEAYVFLAYSSDSSGVFSEAEDMERMGRIVIPEPDEKGSPWLINLSDEGIRHLGNGWNHGIRYDGSSKLFIQVN